MRPTYHNATFYFKRALGAVYFCAFLSLYLEAQALIGSRGLLPLAEFLSLVGESAGDRYFSALPTLFWFNTSDQFLSFTIVAGCLLSLLLFLGIAEFFATTLLWILYLSLLNVGQDFLSFQWDVLLVESGFLAIFIASPELRGSRIHHGRWLPFLFRWLLFRLVFMSGLVKILSGDPNWRNLSALAFHYETQPLPTMAGYLAHQLPAWFQQLSTLCMFAIELVLPVCFFFPVAVRRVAFPPLVAFQLLIFLTGNYTFFNLLTIALCFFLLDDDFLRARAPRWLRLVELPGDDPPRWRGFLHAGLAALILAISVAQFGGRLGPGRGRFAFLRPFYACHLANGYGLFAIMTTERNEIVLEGSLDGKEWREYAFKWKPGSLTARPRRVAPLQPRLDWQMWFAALGSCRQNVWFLSLIDKLLRASPEIAGLLAKNPFPDAPPLMVRSSLYRYEFTGLAELWEDGRWWKRTFVSEYCPLLSRHGDPAHF